MSRNNPTRLSEIIDRYAPEGANDARWFLFEHQLEQAKISAQTVVGTLKNIAARPENEAEREAAQDCAEYCLTMLTGILAARASCGSYLSGTNIADRVARKEM